MAGPVMIVVCFLVLPAAMLINQSGAPAGRTGAPGDGNGTAGNNGSCADVGCHNTYPVNSGTGSVTIDAPTQFSPGTPVEFIVSVHDTTRFRFGFQATIKNAGAENVGTFELVDSNTRFSTGNSDYVTHTLANANAQWTVRWNPPAEITEDVTIYVGGNAADGRFNTASDRIYENQVLVGYAQSSGVDDLDMGQGVLKFSMYPNPLSNRLNIDYELARDTNVSWSLFDVLGRHVFHRELGHRSPGSYDEAIEIDLAGISPGVYVGQLRTEHGSSTRTVSIVR